MGLAPKPGSSPVPAELFERLPVLKPMINRRSGDRSSGQQQQRAIGSVIRMLADRKTMAIVLVEQYCDFAAELADQYLVMERGEIVMHGRGADMEADGVRQKMSI
jgi:urea transport system ATP-binding protein